MIDPPTKLYHGTTADLPVGTVLRPARRGKWVYLAETPEAALVWAGVYAHRTGGAGPNPDDPTGYGTVVTVPLYVYEVRAEDPHHFRTGWQARRATIVARVKRVAPPGRDRGRRFKNPTDSSAMPVPVVVRSASLAEVLASFSRAHLRGRHGEAPGEAKVDGIISKGDDWVLALVPIRFLNYQDAKTSSPERVLRAAEYGQRGARSMPPGLAFYNERSQRKRGLRAYVADGNHRTLGAELMGAESVRMWMPRSEFEALQRQVAERA